MKRDQRLQSARHWLSTYTGKSLVRGYKNHFGVDEVCALLELKELGKQIDEKRIERARLSAERRGEAKASRQCYQVPFDIYPDSDDHHYYVAGYTAGGFAYGTIWEEAEAAGYLDDERKRCNALPKCGSGWIEGSTLNK